MKKIIVFLFTCFFYNLAYMQQSVSKVVMIRPAHFGYNAETAVSNAFQNQVQGESPESIQAKAVKEFDSAVNILTNKGIEVLVFEDTKTPIKPDAVFPNNWVSFHADGRIFLYPMNTPNRRIERRDDIVKSFSKNYAVKEVVDWSSYENNKQYLEGTGSVVFDHINKLTFASLSPRTNADLVNKLAQELRYKPIIFTSTDRDKKSIYHTNVMLTIGTRFAVVCVECIADTSEREMVLQNLRLSADKEPKEIVQITFDQMAKFAGNMLELQTSTKKLIVLSQTALESLTETQKSTLSQYGELTPFYIPTIEKIGGGSARCMIAEVFLK